MIFSDEIKSCIADAINQLYGSNTDANQILLEPTNKEYIGDVTFVVFPYLKLSKQNPYQTAQQIGQLLLQQTSLISNVEVVKGFLNITINDEAYLNAFINPKTIQNATHTAPVLVEYSSPNTNKPLHLGHVRNILLGFSLSRILAANGYPIKKVNIVNDRGIHICKSMLAWQLFGNNETPQTTAIKGDHLVGKYYVVFDAKYRAQVSEMMRQGIDAAVAEKQAPLMLQVQQMLRLWEAGDEKTIQLWQTMNGWVYEGFDATYQKLGVDFDEIYYESNTYLLGKEIVYEGLQKGVFFKKEDGSVWVDLTDEGLDFKLLLRSDGTSVYITQDLGTAKLRFEKYKFEKLIYVVGNEQDYHFKVLKLIFKKLGYAYWDKLFHMSYNMVDLPSGKMKSREGTVVDADDLIAQTISNAETLTRSMAKLDVYDDANAQQLYHTIGMGALKYYILKVDPEKRMLFNPAESIDINGNTGPFIQYAYARIQSILRKAQKDDTIKHLLQTKISLGQIQMEAKEKELLKAVLQYQSTVNDAAIKLSPALIAAYAFETAKLFNQFYHDHVVIDLNNSDITTFRLQLSLSVANCLRNALYLLGIDVADRM